MAVNQVAQKPVVQLPNRSAQPTQAAPARALPQAQDQLAISNDPLRPQVLAALGSGEKPTFKSLDTYKDFSRSAVGVLRAAEARLASAQAVLGAATAARTAKERDVNLSGLKQALDQANELQLDAVQPGRHQAAATLKETEAMTGQLVSIEQRIAQLQNAIARDEAMNRRTERNLRNTDLSDDRATAGLQVVLGAGAVAGLAASKAGIARMRQEIVQLTGQRVQVEVQIQTKQALAQQFAQRPGVPSQIEATSQRLEQAKQAFTAADAEVKPLRDREQLASSQAASAKSQADKASALVSHLKNYDEAFPVTVRAKWRFADSDWKQDLDRHWQSLR